MYRKNLSWHILNSFIVYRIYIVSLTSYKLAPSVLIKMEQGTQFGTSATLRSLIYHRFMK